VFPAGSGDYKTSWTIRNGGWPRYISTNIAGMWRQVFKVKDVKGLEVCKRLLLLWLGVLLLWFGVLLLLLLLSFSLLVSRSRSGTPRGWRCGCCCCRWDEVLCWC
jgi:hypothetical protein